MSSAGIYAQVIERGIAVQSCLIVGVGIPRIHHGDGCPIFLVAEHHLGAMIRDHQQQTHELVAYPVAWPGPGKRSLDRWVYAKHEALPWDAPIPLFDQP